MRTYLVCITNNSHRLLNSIYTLKHDQLGFIVEDKLFLYWLLPTKTLPYIGDLTNLQLIGMKLYRSKLKTKWSEKLYTNYFKTLKTSLPLLEVVKGLYTTLTGSKSETEDLYYYINALFYQPELCFSDSVMTEPKCKDLVMEICSKPLCDISHHENTLNKVKKELDLHILSEKTLALLEIKETKDSIIILERDKSLANKLQIVKTRLMASLESKNINLLECVDLVNMLLSIYNQEEMIFKHDEISLTTCYYDDIASIGQKKIPIELITNETLSKLTKSEMISMLGYLNEEIPNSNNTTLKVLLTKALYTINDL